MVVIVALLYILGFAAVLTSFFVASVVTRRAILSIEEDRRNVLEQLRRDVNGAKTTEEGDRILEEKFDRLRAAFVPPGSAIGAGNTVQAAQFTMLRVLRANTPTAVVLALGGFLSTVASVWSLYL